MRRAYEPFERFVGEVTAVEVAVVVPPRDVHQVSNRGSETAVSIHVYGSDIGRQRRHAIDPETGAVRPFVSGYDQPVLTALKRPRDPVRIRPHRRLP